MSVKYKVVAITGKYQQDGQEKNRYADLGVVMETRNGLMIKFETVPVGWDGWAYLNEPKPREDRKTSGRPMRDEFSDDLP